MIISKNAIKIKNNKNISKQIAEKLFQHKYGEKYQNTAECRLFKEKFIKKWTQKILQIEYFYDEQLEHRNINYK